MTIALIILLSFTLIDVDVDSDLIMILGTRSLMQYRQGIAGKATKMGEQNSVDFNMLMDSLIIIGIWLELGLQVRKENFYRVTQKERRIQTNHVLV